MPDYRKKKPKLKNDEPGLGRVLGRVGIVTRQPLFWLGVTAILATSCGPKGKLAARRGVVCYLTGAVLGNLPKPLFGRPQPRHRRPKKPQIIFGAFPSGHSAAEGAYVFGASMEMPSVFVPLGFSAMIGHWALVRARKHYDSDIIAGGLIGLGIALAAARLWPPSGASEVGSRGSLRV